MIPYDITRLQLIMRQAFIYPSADLPWIKPYKTTVSRNIQKKNSVQFLCLSV